MRGNASILWASPPRIELVPAPDSDVAAAVLSDGEWNGSLLRVIGFSNSNLTLVPSSYSHLAAARSGDGMGNPLFLAVTGVTRVQGGFVLGKRAMHVSNGGKWEFAPSGGVQSLPIEEQMIAEAVEELGVTANSLSIGLPVALYADASEFTADVVIPLQVDLSATQLLSVFTPGEYDSIQIMGSEQLSKLLREDSEILTGVTRFAAGLITEGHKDLFL